MIKPQNVCKYLALPLIVAYVILCFVFIAPLIPQATELSNPNSFKGVLTLVNVDTFEGGSISKSSWLSSRAKEYEKTNKGVYLNIKDMTVAQLESALSSGLKFDLISFGAGVGCKVLGNLVEYKGSNPISVLAQGGRYNNTTYAVPYMFGGYALLNLPLSNNISNFKDALTSVFDCHYTAKYGEVYSLNVGFNSYIQPLVALMTNTTAKATHKQSVSIDQCKTQYQAYTQLLTNRYSTFTLGTQRDIYKMDNKVANGGIASYSVKALGGFTDIVQYMAVGNTDKAEYSQRFVEYVLSDKSQTTLSKVGMLSPVKQLYSNGNMYALQQALASPTTINVFTSESVLQQIRSKSVQALSDDVNLAMYLC